MSDVRVAPLLLALVLLCGCTKTMFVSTAKPAGGPHTQAALRRVDITPPAGLSLWGHGPESRVATGRMTRLWCQVFVIVGAATASDDGDGVALVTCDMAWPSLLVQRQIARRVAWRSEQADVAVPFGADRIWIMVTHTHAGMGHLWPWKNYSGPLSARLRGFDIDAVNFIAERVGDAIFDAHQSSLFEARLAWGTALAYGIGHNRSLAAFDHNRRRPASLLDDALDPDTWRPLAPAERATDPRLSMLRVDRVTSDGTVPAGALAIFGVHPAVVANDNDLYHGDLFGFAVDHAQTRLGGEDGTDIVIGIANGIEGDVAPSKHLAAPRESRRLGVELGDRIAALHGDLEESMASDDAGRIAVKAAYRDLYLPGAETSQGRLCRHPMLGAAAGGGAEDNPTRLRIILQNNPGVRRRPDRGHPCHDEKLGVQAPILDFEPGTHFPAYVPIAIARIGDGILATVPAEVTTVTGLRIRDAIIGALALEPDDVVAIAGLTGGYIQYVATEDEYPLQLYEGASTLYGPSSSALLVDQVGCLASQALGDRRLACPGESAPLMRACDSPCDDPKHDKAPCPEQHQPVDCPFPVPFPDDDTERLVCGGDDDERRAAVSCPIHPAPVIAAVDGDRDVHRVLTEDGELGYEFRFRARRIDQGEVYNRRLVTVCLLVRRDDGGYERHADDRGTRITVRTAIGEGDSWSTTWRPPLPERIVDDRGRPDFDHPEYEQRAEAASCGRRFKMVVQGFDVHDLFAPHEPPDPCDLDDEHQLRVSSEAFVLDCETDLSRIDASEGRKR